MKRILSLFLSMVLVLSMVLGTYTVNVFAEVAGGTFKNDSGVLSKEIKESFTSWEDSSWTNWATTSLSNTEQGYKFFRRLNELNGSNKIVAANNKGRGAPLSVITSGNNKYIELKDIASDGYAYSRYMFYTDASVMLDSENLYFSIDIKTDDTYYTKQIGITDHQNVEQSDIYCFTEFRNDGNIYFFEKSTPACAYETGLWYHIDILYDCSDKSAKTYITNDDGLVVSNTFSNIPINTYFSGDTDDLAFLIYHSKATHPDPLDSTKAADLYDSSVCIDNLNMFIYDDSQIITDIPAITSIGSDGNKVSYDATELIFTMDGSLPDLKAEHLKFTPANSATSIDITSDGSVYTIKAQLESELLPWTSYKLELDKACLSGGEYEINSSGLPEAVEPISANFEVTPAPFSLKTPEFSVSGTTLTAETVFVNNTATPKWAYFMLVTKDASGAVTNISTLSKKDITTNENGETITLTAPNFAEGSAKLFVIDGYTNELLFDVSYGYNYDESEFVEEAPVASTVASSGEMVLGKFDYSGKEITVDLNAGSDSADANGVIYIYKRGTALKDNLVYADFVTVASDGSLEKTVAFPDDINDTTGEYTAAFYADGIALSEDFPIYDSAAAFGGNVLKSAINAKGVKYNTYKSDITESILDFTLGVAHSSTTFDENAMNIKFSRTDKEDGYRIEVSPGAEKQTEGVHTVKFKFYADKAKDDGRIDWLHGEDFAANPGTWERGYISVNRVSSSNTDGSYDLKSLRASTWYEIEIKFDLEDTYKSYITVTNVATGEKVIENNMAIKGTNGFTNMWMYLAYDTETSANNLMLIKDLQILADYGDMKSVIRYIGENDSVDYNQNEISFKISEDNGLTKDNIRVKDAQGNITKAKSITVTEDMGEYVVTAVMEKNFVSYKNYTLEVDSIGYEEYVEYADGEYVAVKPLTRAFTTPAAPLDITDPVITSDGSSVTFTADISNTSGSIVNATTILTVVSSDGITRSVTADSDSLSGADTKSFSNTNAFALGNTANYFVIKDFANPVQLFDKTWSVNYDGSYPAPAVAKATAKASAKTIVLDEFEYNTSYDHKNNKIVVNLNTGKNDFVSGVLYVYSGDVMSDGNLPVYAAYITTAADGTLEMEIPFDSSFASVSGSYKVAFYSSELDSAMEKGFDVYSSSDYANYKRLNILARAKASSTFSGLKQIITGTDDMGNVVDDAWTIFSGDADVSVYNTLKNKEAVFVSLSSTVKSLANYDALCDAFERLAIVQKNKENNPTPSAPSSNNKNTGSSSVSMSATPAAGSSNAGASVGGSSVFSDMSGHWGQKYAESLVAKGIVNGYADGSFRGDNPITRAELTKIVVEALDVPESNGAVFGDVNSSSWYADYVSRANASGVVNGFEDGSFRPEANVSRQDAVLMIYRAMNLTAKLPEGYKFFADEKDIQDYASDAIRCLGDLGIITGTDSKFMPKNNITRAEMAAVICRALDYMESHMQ